MLVPYQAWRHADKMVGIDGYAPSPRVPKTRTLLLRYTPIEVSYPQNPFNKKFITLPTNVIFINLIFSWGTKNKSACFDKFSMAFITFYFDHKSYQNWRAFVDVPIYLSLPAAPSGYKMSATI